jgi:hypothetical protein
VASKAQQTGVTELWFPEIWDVDKLPWISAVISRSIEAVDPPFLQSWYGDRYRQFALDPDWLAHSFIANADKEAEGARKLAAISLSSRKHPFAAKIFAHARDEARHARMYIAMLLLVFPDALSDTDRQDLLATFPEFGLKPECDPNSVDRSIEAILDDIVQMNIGEIRTRLHQMLLRPVATAVCPQNNVASLLKLLGKIYDDEGYHIRYTGEILEHYSTRGFAGLIDNLYKMRLQEFGSITLKEVGVGQFD